MGFGPEQLRDKALAAVAEAAARAHDGPVERSRALAFCLAYLWAYSGGERWPFDNLWQTLAVREDIGRRQGLHANMNAIYNALGLRRP